MVTYNADAVVFAYFSFNFEVLSTGDLNWDYSLRTIDANVNTQRLLVFMETLAILCLAANMIVKTKKIVDAVREFRIIEYVLYPANWLDWVGFIFQLRAWTAWLQFQAGLADIKLENDGNFFVLAKPNTKIRPFSTNATEELRFLQFVDAIRILTDQQIDYSSCQGIVVILYTFKVIKSLDFQAGIGLITRTLSTAGNNLIHYLILFMFVFCGYSVAGNVMFGSQFADFSTITRAFQTLMFMLMSFSSNNFYAQMQQAVKRVGAPGVEYTLFIWSFVFVGNLILLNILLAIIVEAYKKVALYSEEASSVMEDMYDVVVYTACRWFLPSRRFVSDEQLLSLARAELSSINATSGRGIKAKMARSEASLMPDKAVLLGGGVCMDKTQVGALAKQVLDSEAVIPKRRSIVDMLASSVQISLDENTAEVAEDVVHNLMERYGEPLEGKSEAIAQEVQHLLALENQGRLLKVEARLAGLEGSLQVVQGLLTDLLSRSMPNTPLSPASFPTTSQLQNEKGNCMAAATVHVTIVDAKALPRTDLLIDCRSFCLVHIASSDGSCQNANMNSYHMTKTAVGSDPSWNESFELPVPQEARALVVSVWDSGVGSDGDDLIGSAEVPLSDLQAGSTGETWYKLNNPPLASRLRGAAVRFSFRLVSLGLDTGKLFSSVGINLAASGEIVFAAPSVAHQVNRRSDGCSGMWTDREMNNAIPMECWSAGEGQGNASMLAKASEVTSKDQKADRPRWSARSRRRQEEAADVKSNGMSSH